MHLYDLPVDSSSILSNRYMKLQLFFPESWNGARDTTGESARAPGTRSYGKCHDKHHRRRGSRAHVVAERYVTAVFTDVAVHTIALV